MTRFEWRSPLGAAVLLFVALGLLLAVGGALAVIAFSLGTVDPPFLFVSNRADTAYYGGTPADLLRADPALAKMRMTFFIVSSGLNAGLGALQAAIAWFALRRRQRWALGALVVQQALVIPLWALALLPYARVGAPLTLSDVPPFMWWPIVATLVGGTLAWRGLRDPRVRGREATT